MFEGKVDYWNGQQQILKNLCKMIALVAH